MAEVLQEFLIPVTFKVDAASEARMRGSIRNATLQSNLLADAIEGSIKAFGQIMRKVAENLDQMFYASQRTAASVENIKAFGYAAAQLGSSIGEANSALETFGKFLRSNPGSYNLLERMGISTKENGKVRDTGRLLEDLGEKLAKMPRYMQQQYASLFGISDKVLFAITSPEFRQKAEERRAILRRMGLDEDKAAEASRGFAQALGRVEMVLAAIATKVEAAIIERFGDSISRLGDFLIRHGDEIADTITKIAETTGKMITKFLEGVTGTDNLDDAFSKILKTIRTMAEWIDKLIDRIERLIDVINKFGRDSGATAWLGWFMGFKPHELEGGNAGGGGGPGGVVPPGGVRGGADTRNWWQRHAPSWMGGKEAPDGGAGGGGPATGGAGPIPRYGKLTQDQKSEMASAIRATAAKIGARPEDLAAVMSFETGGTMHPQKKGGDGGRYWGLIQWSPENRKKYFGSDEAFMRATIPEQVEAAGRYLKDRGYKPGMPLEALYSAVLAGRAEEKYWGRTDSNGTSPRSGAANMRSSAHGQALAGLERGAGGGGGGGFGFIGGAYAAPAQPRGGGAGGNPYGGLPDTGAFQRPLDGGVNQAWNRSVTNNMSMKTDIKVDGAADPATTAALIGSRVDINHRNFADRLRNFQGAAQ